MIDSGNPRFLPGNISGLGMTADDNGRAVDTRYGINLDTTNGCLIEHPSKGDITLAYAVDGPLEGTTDRVRSLYLLTPEVAAQVVSELSGLLLRADPDAAAALFDRLAAVAHEAAPEEDAAGEPDERGEETVQIIIPVQSGSAEAA